MKRIILSFVIFLTAFIPANAEGTSLITFDDSVCETVSVEYRIGGALPPDGLLETLTEYRYETTNKNEIKQIIDCINGFVRDSSPSPGRSTDGEYLKIHFRLKNKDEIRIYLDASQAYWACGEQFFILAPEEYKNLKNLIDTFRTKNDVSIYFDNILFKPYASPMIIDSRTLIPAVSVRDILEIDMIWNGDEHSVTFSKNGNRLEVVLNADCMIGNGEKMQLDVGGQYENSHGFVPLRAVAEFFGYEVDWKNNTVYIFSKS